MRISYGRVRSSGYNARTGNNVSMIQYAQGAQTGLTATQKKLLILSMLQLVVIVFIVAVASIEAGTFILAVVVVVAFLLL